MCTSGSSTNLAEHLGLPIANHLVERTPEGGERELGSSKFYVPGSILETAVDNTVPVAYGMGEENIVEIARRLQAGKTVKDLRDLRGVAYALGASETPPRCTMEGVGAWTRVPGFWRGA